MREIVLDGWIVQEAVNHSMTAEVVGIEQRGNDFAVLIEDEEVSDA